MAEALRTAVFSNIAGPKTPYPELWLRQQNTLCSQSACLQSCRQVQPGMNWLLLALGFERLPWLSTPEAACTAQASSPTLFPRSWAGAPVGSCGLLRAPSVVSGWLKAALLNCPDCSVPSLITLSVLPPSWCLPAWALQLDFPCFLSCSCSCFLLLPSLQSPVVFHCSASPVSTAQRSVLPCLLTSYHLPNLFFLPFVVFFSPSSRLQTPRFASFSPSSPIPQFPS